MSRLRIGILDGKEEKSRLTLPRADLNNTALSYLTHERFMRHVYYTKYDSDG